MTKSSLAKFFSLIILSIFVLFFLDEFILTLTSTELKILIEMIMNRNGAQYEILLKIFIISLIIFVSFFSFFKNKLNDKALKYIFLNLIFLNTIFIRYFEVIIKNLEIYNIFNLRLMVFLSVNFIILIIFLLIPLLTSSNSKLSYFIITIFYSYPMTNFINFNEFIKLLIGLFVTFFIFYIFQNKQTLKILSTFLIFFTLINFHLVLFNIIDETEGIHLLNPVLNKEIFFEEKLEQNITKYSDTPIFLFWFDEFPGSLLVDDLGNIRSEFKNFYEFGNQSNTFKYNHSMASSSFNSINAQFRSQELLNYISKSHQINTVESITNICKFTNCGNKRQISNQIFFLDVLAIYLNLYFYELLPNHIPPIDSKFANFWNISENNSKNELLISYKIDPEIKNTIDILEKSKNNTFLFSHIRLPHEPWKVDAFGNIYGIKDNSIFLDNSVREWTNDYNKNEYFSKVLAVRQINQTVYLDKLFGNFIQILKNKKLYDKSLIVVSADHGISFIQNTSSRKGQVENIGAIYNVPLVIKLPYQSEKQLFDNVSSSLLINQVIKDILEDKQINLENSETKFTVLIENWDKLSDIELKNIDNEKFKNKINEYRGFYNEAFSLYKNNFNWVKDVGVDLNEQKEITNEIKYLNIPENSQNLFSLSFKTQQQHKIIIVNLHDKYHLINLDKPSNNFEILLDKLQPSSITNELRFYVTNE